MAGSRARLRHRSGRVEPDAPDGSTTVRTPRAFVQRALNRARHLTVSLSLLRRVPLALALIASLLVSAVGLPEPARAAPPSDPAARLQYIIKELHIIDDEELI